MHRLCTLALLAALVAPVRAEAYHPIPDPPDRTFPGSCSFDAVGDTSRPTTNYSGFLYAVTNASSSNRARNPVVYEYARCELLINWSTVVATTTATTSGSYAVAPPVQVAFSADDDDIVRACLHYAIVDALGVRSEGVDCGDYTTEPVWWSTWLGDVVGWAGDEADALVLGDAEAALCAQLAALPLPPDGPVTVDATGDVYLDGQLFWDCPPYAT